MADVDLGGATLVLNDEDYQSLRAHAKGKILYLNMDLILNIRKTCQN